VAISFFVKRHKHRGCKIFYARRPEMETAEDKINYIANTSASKIHFDAIIPDKNRNWLSLTSNDWEDLVPLADKATKATQKKSEEESIFKSFTLGIVTARDEWVYDQEMEVLESKVNYLIKIYSSEVEKQKAIRVEAIVGAKKLADRIDYEIKWSRAVKGDLRRERPYDFSDGSIIQADYRPFCRQYLYYSSRLNEMLYQTSKFFPGGKTNQYIASVAGSRLNFCCFSGKYVPSYATFSLDPAQNFPRFRYSDKSGVVDNITDWGLKQFQSNYKKQKITKDDIFHYVYGVLHDPVYREKYAINLKREFPRIPFYPDFQQWAAWGKRLMDIHIGYEAVEPWPLERIDIAVGTSVNKAILKADKDNGSIRLDGVTTLTGVPRAAWEYRLGNRSGLEWILDQYKDKKPKDPTIAAKFNTYRFADYKEKVIDLLARVTRVSVETMEIVEAMKKAKRDA
jgi:predicted helicase